MDKPYREISFAIMKLLNICHITAAMLFFIFALITFSQAANGQKSHSYPKENTSNSFADSVIKAANAKLEEEYTVPSFTLLKIALRSATENREDKMIKALYDVLKELQPKEMPFSIVLNINGDPATRMAFNWFTNAGITGGKVQIVQGIVSNNDPFIKPEKTIIAVAEPLDNLNYSVSANRLNSLAGISNNTKKSYMSNKALAAGLKPNTTYSYRVGKESRWSQTGYFKTAKPGADKFSFLYTTDSQANTYEMFDLSQKTTHAALKMFPDINFWLHCGDLIQTGGKNNSEWEWEQFFLTQQDILLNKPFAPTHGNHDISENRNFTFHFNTSSPEFDNTMSATPGGIYSFVCGSALFFAISFADYRVPEYLNSLAKWMHNEVKANPGTKWRIAYFHKPMFTGSKSHQGDSDGKIIRNRMVPLFDSLKIDLALQGHDHIYEVIGPVLKKQLVYGTVSDQIKVPVNPPENVTGLSKGIFNVKLGTLYFLNNSSGKKKYEPRSKKRMDNDEVYLGVNNYFGLFSGRFGQAGKPTFSNVIVSQDTISITTYEVAIDGTASLFDEIKVIK
jgi:hypothetical protein